MSAYKIISGTSDRVYFWVYWTLAQISNDETKQKGVS